MDSRMKRGENSMKRRKELLLLLLAAVLLSGCHKKTQSPSETTVATVEETAPTEAATEPAYIGIAEELLLREDTVTVSFNTAAEYEAFIRELGYSEFVLNYYAGNNFSELACKPLSLSYNDQVMRLDFSYIDHPIVNRVTDLETEVLFEGWVMYGMKADEAMNITGLDFADYEWSHSFDWMDQVLPAATKKLDHIPQMIQTECYDDDLQMNPTSWAYHASNYYPHTGNLYNFLYVAKSMDQIAANTPRVLLEWDEALMEVWQHEGTPSFEFVVCRVEGDNKLVPGNPKHIYLTNTTGYFESGMTLKDWAESAYNHDRWRYVNSENGPVLYSPEKHYVAMIACDSQGNMVPIDSGNNNGVYEVSILPYEDYCLLTGQES